MKDFHYYLCRQLKGGGMEIFMEEQSIAMAVFTSIVQGILVAGLSTYINQTVKQIKKEE